MYKIKSMKNPIILLCTILFFAIGCTDRDDDITGVNIRIKNNSSVDFDEVQVGDAENVHNNVAAGDFSEYLVYDIAFQFAFIEAKSGDGTYILQPIDFVGETPLEIGFYTYELSITEEGNISLNFIVD